ncbi:MAG: DUF1343 domain-containing protein [Candidatus Eremiobacteraeota bacterium]|nr:DUF1343 domain-containing protein [Candidatus Eremiobacteraeota bacterium]
MKSTKDYGKYTETNTSSGIDILRETKFRILNDSSVGLLVNQATVDKNLDHDIDILLNEENFELKSLFGPQHGLYGQTQDNMIEWTGFRDRRTGLPVYSLYGNHRKPTDEMLEGIDTLVVDFPDVGTRYYTFLWTAKLCMEACAQKGIRMIVLDRPNPIGGEIIEGPMLDPEYKSFVGLSVLPVRHGMTMGELLAMINREEEMGCVLEVIKMQGWSREMWFDDTGLPWVIPSPNMPTIDTATVYPGGCLLEATNISEGRGTCRPFEIIGAPYIEPYAVVDKMKKWDIEGVILRPVYFEPTFGKHTGKYCGGIQLHITDRNKFRSVKTFAIFISLIKKMYPDQFAWKNPPYEYEYEKMPIDILWGDSSLRESVDNMKNPEELFKKMNISINNFRQTRKDYLLYS